MKWFNSHHYNVSLVSPVPFLHYYWLHLLPGQVLLLYCSGLVPCSPVWTTCLWQMLCILLLLYWGGQTCVRHIWRLCALQMSTRAYRVFVHVIYCNVWGVIAIHHLRRVFKIQISNTLLSLSAYMWWEWLTAISTTDSDFHDLALFVTIYHTCESGAGCRTCRGHTWAASQSHSRVRSSVLGVCGTLAVDEALD